MKIKTSLFAAAVLAAAIPGVAQQPYGGCWHPDDIINWSPESDPDAKFNRSRVPLAARVYEPELMKATEGQYYDGQITNATILFPTCSLSPSQGANNFVGYQPTYWQYMDKLVYWAGSASEGIIIPPPAASTDAAHQQGVKSLGQIFMPPSAFGGIYAWVSQMLTEENGEYPYARKCYEIAKYMGFDGWFINEEIGYDDKAWAPWVKAYMDIAIADGHPEHEIQWYNADRTPSEVMLKTHKSTSQFLEYGAVGDYRNYASRLDCTEQETFSKIFAGVQVVSNGHTGYQYSLNKAMPETGHVGSLALFCPEERIWKDNVKNILNSSDNCGPVAYAAITKTFENEEDMWVNLNGDPSNPGSSSSWRGLSSAVLERTVISSLPFVSTMSVGVGKHRFVEGEIRGTQDWNHSGMQSILPTWRWWIENRGDLKVSIDWDNAYNSGSSFCIEGNLSEGDHLMRLYKTQIQMPASGGAKMRVVYRTNNSNSSDVTLEGKFSTASSINPDVTILPTIVGEKNGWTVAEYDLTPIQGKTLYMVALNLKSDAAIDDFSLNLAELDLFPSNYSPSSLAVSNFATSSVLGEEKGDIRLTWDWDDNADFDHFNIYTITNDGIRTLVGQTRDEAYYIPTFLRNGTDDSITVELVPIMKDLKEGSPSSITLDYPKATAPVVRLSLTKSYIMVGETVQLTAKGTGAPSGYEWVLPEGLKVADGYSLTSNPIVVEAVSAGLQTVTVKATNAVGTSETVFEAIDVMENEDQMNEIVNVALHKTVVGYSGSTNSQEVPSKIVDGITNPNSTADKWCNVAPDNWVIFDLENTYCVYGFRIYDANSGPESGCDQINSYEIYLSDDGEVWNEVLAVEGAEKESIKTDYIMPTNGRFVKLVPHVGGTLRIWEFEVYGKDNSKMAFTVEPKPLTLTTGETMEVIVSYNLNGDERSDDFYCTATPASKLVIVGQVKEDKDKSQFIIPVTSSYNIGGTSIEIAVHNGPSYKLQTLKVVVDNPDLENILSGMEATLRVYSTDSDGDRPQFDTIKVNGLTDGDTVSEALTKIETPSTHSFDIWAIFECPDGGMWDLAKVSVFIPDGNIGVNDNDREGFVNKDIKICYGNNLDLLTDAITFSNLEETSTLEYIFPTSQLTKYIVVKCNLNAFFYASLAEIQAYEQAQFPGAPLELTGWTDDIILERKWDAESASGSLDKQNHVFYSDETVEGSISDESRMVVSNSGVEYRLADYTQNNAVVMKDGDSHELQLVKPEKISTLFFLMTSAEGSSTVEIVAKYADGTQSEPIELEIADWYSETPGIGEAVYGIGRYSKEGWYYDYRLFFRLFEFSAGILSNSELSSISVRRISETGYPTLLAVSKKDLSTGFDVIENDIEQERTIVGVYNLQGIPVKSPVSGIYIIRYSDNTTKKILVK